MIKLPLQTAVGKAHSKLILIGEHAVVYGKPALALPFPLEVTSSVSKGEGTSIVITSSFFTGSIDKLPAKMKGIAVLIRKTLAHLRQEKAGLTIRIDSTIPIGRGLGSSAAIAVSLVRGLYRFFQKDLPRKQLMKLVHIAETYAHGKPSGIDMAAVSSDTPIWFQIDKPTENVIIKKPVHLVVADTGRIGDTHAAVANIKELMQIKKTETERSIDLLGDITIQCKAMLIKGDHKKLGELLDTAQTHLNRLGVSDAGIEQLVSVAKRAGALGAKLTGGGRGGCMLALASDKVHAKNIASELKAAGAHKTWDFTIMNS